MKLKLISIVTSFSLLFSLFVPSITFGMEAKTIEKPVVNGANKEEVLWVDIEEENNAVSYDENPELFSTLEEINQENITFIENADGIHDIDWDSIPIELAEHNTVQPFIWGTVARLVISGGKYVIKWGSKVFKIAPKSKVTNALSSFKTATYKTGSHSFKLTKTDMKHMLERHHPKYWNGTVKKSQTFYNPNLSVTEVKNIAMTIAKDNSKTLAKKGTNSTFQVEGSVGGVKYVLGIT
ncbi:hypothetical protein MKZ08_09680 [Viridibacillus sp. FSL R5-0477]|uniref:Transposase n=1 Tax=Viridibacillus arenosi FSL R5-213 TaxID=1227360 RepID=W4F2M8_9BACL|nr:hypothetical protein [Viridibacillus arenosi]ETT86744.1 transposase [Viridibacillus arenosi FSL R5-213]OMC89487.1 hypothetical protein BK137_17200 [Viridibacillus arenosi]